MTGIDLPGCADAGLGDWGRKTPAEMIALYREKARHDLKVSQEILAAKDSDFKVVTYLGRHVRRNRETLQEGRSL